MNSLIPLSRDKLIDVLVQVLDKDERVAFAYLYGSIFNEGSGNDVDVAVYPNYGVDDTSLSIDLKIALHKNAGIPPEAFDIRNLSRIIEKGDVFTLLYLRNVLENGLILVNKTKSVHADFLERYGSKFRECEGLMQEVLA